MRAGKLDQTIGVYKYTHTGEDPYGAPQFGWVKAIDLRAQRVETSTEEFFRTYGVTSETLTVFRTRYYPGVTPADQIRHDGLEYNIREIKPIGRRRGLEFRCVAVGGAS